jgi:hypothetical protein
MKKIGEFAWILALLLLTLPLTMPRVYRIYRTAVVIPRFEAQEGAILRAINRFHAERGHLPAELSELVPEFLRSTSLKFGDWPFLYRADEDGEAILTTEVPSRWAGRPARRICRSKPGRETVCTYHFICRSKGTVSYLTEPVSSAALQGSWLSLLPNDPCVAPG